MPFRVSTITPASATRTTQRWSLIPPNDFQGFLDNPNYTTIELQTGTYFQNAVINRDLTIRGKGIGRTTVSGGLLGSVFKILPGCRVHLEDMTILGGLAPSGGGIFNDGSLFVARCEIRDCRAYGIGGEGGGIFNRGGARLMVTDSFIRGNVAAHGSPGVERWPLAAPVMGWKIQALPPLHTPFCRTGCHGSTAGAITVTTYATEAAAHPCGSKIPKTR